MSNNPYSGYSNFDQIKLNDNYGKNCHQIGKRRNSKNEIIHSGHFMVSEIDEIEENDKNELESSQPGNDSDQISIDQSLRKLFQCMSLAYDDEKLTSPKWKTFKGLKLNIKDKIRLNNIIWRAWHIQYVSGRRPAVCQFSSNVDTERHNKTETILLEGKYWKRCVDVVKAEYNKWRLYYQHIFRKKTRSKISNHDWESDLPRWTNNLSFDSLFYNSNAQIPPNNEMISNQYGNYYDYANSREIARSGMGAEFMQPVLEQLQPSIDFVDNFEPIQNFMSLKAQLPSLIEQNEFSANNNLKEMETRDELLDSIFSVDSGSIMPSIDNNTMSNKPMLEQNQPNYNIFASSNNLSLSNGNRMIGTTTTHQQNQHLPIHQSQTLRQNYNKTIEKLTTSHQASNYNYSNSLTYPASSEMNSHSVNPNLIKYLKSNLINQPVNQYEQNNVLISSNNHQNLANSSNSNTFPGTNESTPSIPHLVDNTNRTTDNYNSIIYYPSAQNSNQEKTNNEKQFNSVNIGTKNTASNNHQVLRTNTRKQSLKNIPSSFNTNYSHTSNQRNNLERSLSLPIVELNIDNKQRQYMMNGQPPVQPAPPPPPPLPPPLSSSLIHSEQKLPKENNLNDYNMIQYSNGGDGRLKEKPCEPNCYIDQHLTGPSVTNCSNDTNNSVQSFVTAKNCSTVLNETPGINTLMGINQSGNLKIFNSNETSNSITSSIGSIEKNSVNQNYSTGFSVNTPNSQDHKHLFRLKCKNQNQYSNIRDNLDNTSKVNKNLFSSLDYGVDGKDRFSTTNRTMNSVEQYRYGNIENKSLIIGNEQETFNRQLTNNITPLIPYGTSLSLANNKNDERNRERRRVCHINAEQKRRCNIKNGFDSLRCLLPSLSNNFSTKISKAAMLHKAADYIRILKNEKFEQLKEIEMLKQQIESLNKTISVFQNQLPTTGAPIVSRHKTRIKEQYAKYVHQKTLQNWKFWIFSIIMEALLDSYCNNISTNNFDEMCKSLFRWLEQECCLVTLRKDVFNSLRFVSTSTNILTNPEMISKEILQNITQQKKIDYEDEL